MNLFRKILCIVALLGLLTLCNHNSFGQEQTQPSKDDTSPLSYQLEVGLVQIPIRVVDKKGKWMGGLQKTDLELSEDGIPQEIQYVDEMDMEAEETKATAPEEPLKIDVLSIPETKISRVRSNSILLIVDGCNSSQSALEKHKGYVKDFLRDFNVPHTVFALLFIKPTGDYEMLQNFTSDKTALLNAMDTVRGSTAGYVTRLFATSQISDSSQIEECVALRSDNQMVCAEKALRSVIAKANGYAEEEHLRSKNTIRSLKDIFNKAEHVPGQKSVIFISEGLDPAGSFYYNYAANVVQYFVEHYGLPPTMKTMLTEVKMESNRYISEIHTMRELTKTAGASGLAIFWANPEYGKRIEEISAEVGSIMTLDSKLINAPDTQAMLRDVAEYTGGAALSSTDMKDFYASLSENVRRYYLVSYKPPRTLNDGKFHRIEVRPKNDKLKILYKRDFKDFPIEERIKSEIAAAHDFPQVSTSFSLMSDATYFKKSNGMYQVMMRIGVPYREMEPQIGDRGVRDEIHFSYVIRNDEGEVLENHNPILRLGSKFDEFETLKKSGTVLEYLQNFELPSGVYHVSLVAMDVTGWKTAADSILLRLPGEVDSCHSISPAMLAGQVRKSDSIVKDPKPTERGEMLYGDNVFAFPLHRVFPTKGNLSGFYQIYNAKLPSTIRFRLYRDKTVFVNETPEREIAGYSDPIAKLVTNYFSVPYNNLAPGAYELEIIIKDKSCTASTRAGFEIVAQASSPLL